MRKFPLHTTLTCEIIGNDDNAKNWSGNDRNAFDCYKKEIFSLEFVEKCKGWELPFFFKKGKEFPTP